MSEKKPSYNFLLLGKTGSGKSATGNTLLNRDEFETSNSFESCTTNIKVASKDFIRCQMNVVDVPGLHDTNTTFTETLNLFHEGISQLPEGFDALLLVVKLGDKLTQELIDTIDAAKSCCGELFVKQHCIIVFTFGDAFENPNNDNLVEWCKDDKNVKDGSIIQIFLKECGYKVVLFYNNKKEKREESVQKLLSYLHPHNPRYTNETFQKCAEIRDNYVTTKGFPEQRAEIQRDIRALQDTINVALEGNDPNTNWDNIKTSAEELLQTVQKAAAGNDKMDDLITSVKNIQEKIKNASKSKAGYKVILEGILKALEKLLFSGSNILVFFSTIKLSGCAATSVVSVTTKVFGARAAAVSAGSVSLAAGTATVTAGSVSAAAGTAAVSAGSVSAAAGTAAVSAGSVSAAAGTAAVSAGSVLAIVAGTIAVAVVSVGTVAVASYVIRRGNRIQNER